MMVTIQRERQAPLASFMLRMSNGSLPSGTRIIGVLILVLLMAGCYEEATIEFHEPGVYKGKTDPLVQRSGTPEYQAQLQERLTQVQTDR